MKQTADQQNQEALDRATSNGSTRNYYSIMTGFQAKGIPADEISPRENVFTYRAWRALGRQVRKGQHGVKVVTFRTDKHKARDGDDQDQGKPTYYSRPWTATVFHVSQTEAL